MNTIFGKKTKQTQAFLTDGTRVPVSVVAVTSNAVVGVKSTEKHGYTAVQVGFGNRKKPGKTLQGLVKKVGLTNAPYMIREIRISDDTSLPTIGEVISANSVLKAGDIIKVTGTSKGKGFAGVVKRHNFRGGPRTHGQSDRERAPGSIGQTTTPGRVYRGKRMAGRMGHEQVSVTNLQVIAVQEQGGIETVLVKGLIPGGVNTIVRIEKTGELSEKKFVPLMENEKVKMEEKELEAEPATEMKIEEKVEEVAVEEVKEESPKEEAK